MSDTRILLSAIWIVVMLLYLVGDVLRIYSGDYARMSAVQDTSNTIMWMGAAIFMLIPILMIFFSLVLPQEIGRWANIIVAGLLFIFVLVDLQSYPSAYDKFLLAVSMVFNVITIGYAWNWV
jgi:hypothetical protein